MAEYAFYTWMAFLVAIGAVIGSFLNVCVYRLPLQKSILWPAASHCFNCLHPIRPSDNIPILSWWILSGRCRSCNANFSPRYMIIEAFTAILFGFVFWLSSIRSPQINPSQVAFHLILICALLTASLIDLDWQLIPDSVTIPTTLAGLTLSAIWPDNHIIPIELISADPLQLIGNQRWIFLGMLATGWAVWVIGVIWQLRGVSGPAGVAEYLLLLAGAAYLGFQSIVLWLSYFQPVQIDWRIWFAEHPHTQGFLTSLVGLLVGAGTIWVVRVLGSAMLNREAMGFGDVTLMAMIGSFIGWQPVLLVFFLAPFFALGIGLSQWILGKGTVIPYGPYLSMAALFMVLANWAAIWSPVELHFKILASVHEYYWLAVVFLLPMILLSLFRTARSENADNSDEES